MCIKMKCTDLCIYEWRFIQIHVYVCVDVHITSQNVLTAPASFGQDENLIS